MVTPAAMYRRLPDLHQGPRRIAVIAAFTGFPLQLLGYALLVKSDRVDLLLWGLVSIALFSATVFGALAIYGYGAGRLGDRRRLDERQRGIADRAMIVSYAVLTMAIVIVAGAIAVVASFVGPVVIEMTAFTPWLIAIGLYVPLLPFAALAWIEPDAPSDEQG